MRRAAIACLFVLTLCPPALAQGDADQAVCANRGGRLPAEQVTAACDLVIADRSQRASVRARAFTGRGQANMQADRNDAAMADFNQAVALDDDNVEARFYRAQLHTQAKDYQAALDDYGAVEKRAPGNVAVHMQRSRIYLAMKRYPEAIAEADFGNGGAGVLNQRCWTRAVAGLELDKARIACDQALWAAPDNPAILDSRALVSLKQKRFQQAWNDYDVMLKAEPRAARAWYGRGLAAIGLGRESEGRADLARAGELNPNIVAVFTELGLPPG